MRFTRSTFFPSRPWGLPALQQAGRYDLLENNSWKMDQDFGTEVANPVEGTDYAPHGVASADGRPVLDPTMNGEGYMTIALKNSRNVMPRDFSVLLGGHFAALVSRVDNLTVDNVSADDGTW
jgi:polygalacturonase